MTAAAVVGVLSGISCLLFFGAEALLTGLIWGDEETPLGYFSGSFTAVVIMLVASVVIGLIRKFTQGEGSDPNFIAEMIEGEVPAKRALRYGVLGLVSLLGGASVGPEAALGTVGGAIGSTAGRRFTPSKEAAEDLTFSGIAGVFGGLLTLPYTGVLMALETYHERWQIMPARMLPAVVSATTALAVLYPVVGTPFLSIYDLGGADLHVSWIPLAVALGALGATLGLLTAAVMGLSGRASRRVANPLVRVVIAGLAISAIGFMLPATLFSGRGQLDSILDGGGAVTLGLLAAIFVGRLATFVLSMRWGFFGGPIFPLIFLGATAGTAVHTLIPSVPLVVAVPAMAAAVTVVQVPLPLTLMVFTTIMFGLTLELSVLPAVAIVTSFVLVRGTGVLARLQERLD